MRRRWVIFIQQLISSVVIGISLLSPLSVWDALPEETKDSASPKMKGWVVGLSEEDFILLSSVVEAESDRSDNIEGKILIAETIFNRANSSNWPSTVRKCITQSGQFQVYYEGTYKSVGRTKTSDLAVIEAYREIQNGSAPNVIYFNCCGYNYLGTPYCYEGGNYFETEP